MNEKAGETQSSPNAPRPNRRPPRPRHRGPRRPRDNRSTNPSSPEVQNETVAGLDDSFPKEQPVVAVGSEPAVEAKAEQPVREPNREQSQREPLAQTPAPQQQQQQRPAFSRPQPQPRPPRPQHQAQPRPPRSPIGHAIAQVEDVIKELRETVRELEEVLETLDDAQRQQIGDEKEIETLRRTLSILQRDRQSSSRDEREPRDQPRRFDRRPENRFRPEPAHPPADAPVSPEEPAE